MQKPKMILFDYGQTLVDEGEFQGVRGAEAVLQYAVKNPCRRTAEEVQRAADQLNRSLGRFGPASGHMHKGRIAEMTCESFRMIDQAKMTEKGKQHV